MKEKILNKYIYEGFGFPITLINVPMIKVMGVWTPHIDYNKLQKLILVLLIHKPSSLTGNEIRFIRQYFEYTMEAFGKLFGLTHAAISKWEKRGNKATLAEVNTERLIRLFASEKLQVHDKIFRKVFREIFVSLTEETKSKVIPLTLDVEKEELLASA